MTELNMGETILKLRKEKGLTQEKLADMIGVSGWAVSKWERGKTKPDIDLLAPLVRALNTTLNDLFSFKEELSESEINEIHKEISHIFLHKGFQDGENKCKEYLNKHPSCLGLKLIVAGLIHMYCMLIQDDNLVNRKLNYALSLLYEIKDSKKDKNIHMALFLIANIQMTLKNYEESEKCLKEIKKSFVDPMIPYACLLEKQEKNKEAKELCEQMLLLYINQGTAMMSILSRIYIKENNLNKAIFYLEKVNEVEHMFKLLNHAGLYNLCKIYLKQGNKEMSAKYFKDYVKASISEKYDYKNNPYFDDLKLEINVEGQKIIRKKLFEELINEEELKGLSQNSDYNDAIESLKVATRSI